MKNRTVWSGVIVLLFITMLVLTFVNTSSADDNVGDSNVLHIKTLPSKNKGVSKLKISSIRPARILTLPDSYFGDITCREGSVSAPVDLWEWLDFIDRQDALENLASFIKDIEVSITQYPVYAKKIKMSFIFSSHHGESLLFINSILLNNTEDVLKKVKLFHAEKRNELKSINEEFCSRK